MAEVGRRLRNAFCKRWKGKGGGVGVACPELPPWMQNWRGKQEFNLPYGPIGAFNRGPLFKKRALPFFPLLHLPLMFTRGIKSPFFAPLSGQSAINQPSTPQRRGARREGTFPNILYPKGVRSESVPLRFFHVSVRTSLRYMHKGYNSSSGLSCSNFFLRQASYFTYSKCTLVYRCLNLKESMFLFIFLFCLSSRPQLLFVPHVEKAFWFLYRNLAHPKKYPLASSRPLDI